MTRLDPVSGSVLARVRVDRGPGALAATGNSLWVLNGRGAFLGWITIQGPDNRWTQQKIEGFMPQIEDAVAELQLRIADLDPFDQR